MRFIIYFSGLRVLLINVYLCPCESAKSASSNQYNTFAKAVDGDVIPNGKTILAVCPTQNKVDSLEVELLLTAPQAPNQQNSRCFLFEHAVPDVGVLSSHLLKNCVHFVFLNLSQ